MLSEFPRQDSTDMRPTHRIRVLVDIRRTRGKDIGRVKPRVHRIGLASIDHEQDLIVAMGNIYLTPER